MREIERDRKAMDMPHAELCRLSGVDRGTWLALRSGKQPPREDTLNRLRAALLGNRQPPAPDVIASFHRLVMVLLAKETGEDHDLMLAQDFSCEMPRDPVWLRAARLRRLAIYITAVEQQVKNVVLGRAIGCTRSNVKRARDQVEDLRMADPALDALLDKVATMAKGKQ